MSPEISLVSPKRSAHAAISGYLYQTCLGVLRWLDLKDDEVLVCEGDEDLDRRIAAGKGVSESEQVKALHGAVNVRDRVVAESLRWFLLTYVALRRRGEQRRFVFTTTARRRRQIKGRVDVLASWNDAGQRPAVIAELREMLPSEKDAVREPIADALGWLDQEGERWPAFIESVDWRFEAPDVSAVRHQIADRVATIPAARTLPGASVTNRLVAELLEASSRPRPEDRARTRQDLEAVLAKVRGDLAEWAATPRAASLQAAFHELDRLRHLLVDGTRTLPEGRIGPGKLLTAAYEVIPFNERGRSDELDALAAWCADARLASVWLWTGEGGTGKSRLMIEWCQRLGAQGWHTGFLHPERTAPELLPLLAGVVPRLVVVDYAETRLHVVKPLLREMALVRGVGPKFRLVLLARRTADWWDALIREAEAIEDLLLGSPAFRVLTPAVDRGEERLTAFHEAAGAFAGAMGSVVPESLLVPDLDRIEFDRVLYLHMAALAAVHGERVEDSADALQRTLDHERRLWRSEAAGLGLDTLAAKALAEAMEAVMAALTLVGGADEDQASGLTERVAVGLRLRFDARAALPDLLRRFYGAGRYLESLQPDLLGEELVAASLQGDASLLDQVLEVADAGKQSHLLTLLARLARRRPETEGWLDRAFRDHLEKLAELALEVAVETGDPVGRILAKRLESGVSAALAERLMARCDQEDYQLSVPLREVAFEATRRTVEVRRSKLREHGAAGTDTLLPELAGALNNLGYRLSDLGRREEALEAACEAVDFRRQLAKARPDAFLPDLATSLNNLGLRLSDLGRREEALAATREAVDHDRQLAEARPDVFLPNLAMSLNNLGNRLSDLGRREEALAATREAVDLRRQLAKARPDALLPYLARSLNNLGNHLSDLGRREEALAATREAVDLRRQLAKARPDAFLADLAMSLNNLGIQLSELGQCEEALAATREAVDLRRQLAAARPDAFLADLATSLNNLGNTLSALGRREEALEASREAVNRLAGPFLRLPDVFRAWMKIVVGNYEKRAEAVGQSPDCELLEPILKILEAGDSSLTSD